VLLESQVRSPEKLPDFERLGWLVRKEHWCGVRFIERAGTLQSSGFPFGLLDLLLAIGLRRGVQSKRASCAEEDVDIPLALTNTYRLACQVPASFDSFLNAVPHRDSVQRLFQVLSNLFLRLGRGVVLCQAKRGSRWSSCWW
jgi:hypothetical protein